MLIKQVSITQYSVNLMNLDKNKFTLSNNKEWNNWRLYRWFSMTSNKFTRKEGKERGERVLAPSTQSVYKRTFGWLDLNDLRHLIVVFMLCFFCGVKFNPLQVQEGSKFHERREENSLFLSSVCGKNTLVFVSFWVLDVTNKPNNIYKTLFNEVVNHLEFFSVNGLIELIKWIM